MVVNHYTLYLRVDVTFIMVCFLFFRSKVLIPHICVINDHF